MKFTKVITKTDNQIRFCHALKEKNSKLVVAVGPAGVGKTMLSVNHAIEKLLAKECKKIVITRPLIGVGDEELGFLPGDIHKKMYPWMLPIYDNMREYITHDKLKSLIANEDIEISPLAYMRGRTFDNSVIIGDEVQNTTSIAMKTLLTRVGSNSQMIITGDLEQSDVKGVNGLKHFLDLIEKYQKKENSNIKIIKFENEDVMRSDLVKEVLDLYNA